MKTTDDIIDELRAEANNPPCPARVAKLLTEAADRLDNLLASGIHTCHANCQRPMCVLRRELKAAQAELAQAQESLASSRSAHDAVVKASQDEHQELVERRIAASKHSSEYNEQFFRAERLQQEQKAADAEFEQLRAALARAESATPDHLRGATEMVAPAKHPDTEIVDWLDTQFQGGDDWCRLFPLGNTIREAYAAVRVTIAEEPL